MTDTTRREAKKAHRIAVDHLFNGEDTGRRTYHRASSAAGLRKVLDRACGEGWGARVYVPRALVAQCGGYVSAHGELLIPMPGGGDPVAVYEKK